MKRIISWNMSYWQHTHKEREAAWEFLQQLSPDFALLQEAVPPKESIAERCIYRPIGGSRRWGSAVLSFSEKLEEVTEIKTKYSTKAYSIANTFPGSVAVAATKGGLTLISMYSVIDQGYAITTFHRQISDLTPLFDSKFGRKVIIAGDWNISSQFKEPDGRRHANAFKRLESLGLVNALDLEMPPRGPLSGCTCKDEPCRHVQTQKHKISDFPWQNDYFYMSDVLSKHAMKCFALNGKEINVCKYSDHCPLVLELD